MIPPIELQREEFKAVGHWLIDMIADHTGNIGGRPVTTGKTSGELQQLLNAPTLPEDGTPAAEIFSRIAPLLFDHSLLNGHPKFMGYITSSAAPSGALADLLAAAVNPNVGAQILSPVATEIEKCTIKWLAEFIGVDAGYGGLLVSGGNMANFTAFLAARTAKAKNDLKEEGLDNTSGRMLIYCSQNTHTWIEKAAALFGHGTRAIRWIPTDILDRMDTPLLEKAVKEDLLAGHQPFMVVGTAGDVSSGAVDDLRSIAAICKTYDLWFHIDGAFGALAILAPELKPRLAGIERADSLAFDFHKWGQVPYDAGFILVRDGALHRDTFASPAAYLRRESRGLAAGSPWPCDFGPDLSRGFRALKVWFTLRTYGTERLGRTIARSCALARYLERRIGAEPRLELLAPVSLNIVCFRFRCERADEVNAAIVADLHESGIAAPSTTTLDGRLTIRAAIVNHRTQPCDIDALVAAVLAFGEANQKRVGQE